MAPKLNSFAITALKIAGLCALAAIWVYHFGGALVEWIFHAVMPDMD